MAALAICLIFLFRNRRSFWITLQCDDCPDTELEAPKFRHCEVSQPGNNAPESTPCGWRLGNQPTPSNSFGSVQLISAPGAPPGLKWVFKSFVSTQGTDIKVKCRLFFVTTNTSVLGIVSLILPNETVFWDSEIEAFRPFWAELFFIFWTLFLISSSRNRKKVSPLAFHL